MAYSSMMEKDKINKYEGPAAHSGEQTRRSRPRLGPGDGKRGACATQRKSVERTVTFCADN